MSNDPASHRDPAGHKAGASRHASLHAWLWGLGALSALFAAYLLTGFYLVPSLLRSQATSWVKTNLDKSIALGEIKFNPLTFTLDIDNIALPAVQPMVAIGHLRVGFSLLSVFQSAYRFTEVTLDQPLVRAHLRPDGSIDLIELKPRIHSEGPSPAVKIDLFTINRGRVHYTDDSQAGRPQAGLIPIAFTLKNFQTNLASGGDLAFDATSERGERFSWRGTLSIAPISSRGRLIVTALKSETAQDFLGGKLPVALTGGQVSVTADYDFAYGAQGLTLNLPLLKVAGRDLSVAGGTAPFRGALALAQVDASAGPIALAAGTRGITRLTAAMPRLALQGLDVTAVGAKTPAIHLGDASLTSLALDFGARNLQLGDLILNGAAIAVERLHNGQISLLSLLPPSPAAQSHSVSAQAMPAAPAPADARPWHVSLGRFTLNGASFDFRDRALAQPAHLRIAPLTITATGAGSDLSQPVNVHFDAGINGKGHAVGDTTVIPASLAGDLNFTLTGLALKPFVPYMSPLKTLELRSGEADASGRLHFEGTKIPALRFIGNVAVNDFSMVETTTNSPLFAWQAFAFQGVDVRNSRVDIRQASLVRPLGQVVVMPDRSFNFTPLMPPKADTGKTDANPAGTARPGTASGGAAPPETATTIAASAHAPPAVTVRLNTLNIRGGSMGFADQSIQPNFAARIDELKGTIENITNAPGQIAVIDLSGQVIDQFSPATIKGSMDLMAYDRKTDMQVVFRNIELPVFNPYSGRYAGYAIGKGKLTTELSYKIDNRALKADHHVIIDQLEWGQATESKEAVPLPVRLATALLKDNKGVIDLDLPVEGSLDDPKFRIWPVIWQVVGNVIVKAVTAPFQLIGSLFAGADKAQYIDFAPGSASLPQGSAESLAALAKALNQRPALKLDIPAGPGTREDGIAMADAAIDKALLADGDGKAASVAALDIGDQHDRLEDIYRGKLGKKPAYPDFSADALKAAPGAKPDADEDDRRTLLETQWLRGEMRKSFAPGNAELAALGTARATAVRNALLADGSSVDPARLFMAADMMATANEGHCRVELKFE